MTAGLVLLCLAFAAGCAPVVEPPPSTPAVFTRGENAFLHGDYNRAVESYRVYLQYPTDDAYIPRAWYKIALSQFQLKEYRQTLTTLDELQAQFPEDTWPQAEALRGDAHLALGNTVSALGAWADAWRAANESERPALRSRFDRTIETMSETEREHAKTVVDDPALRAWLERSPPQPAATPLASAAPKARPRSLNSSRVACLLPLSGPYREFGERSLQGIRLALGAQADRLVVKDTHGQPELARAALAELVARKDIVAVVGPLTSGVAADLAPLADAAALPMLLLAQREGLTSRFVMQPVMTRARQTDTLADYARRLGWRRLGILAPDDRYGRAFAKKFTTAIEHSGGRIVWSGSYRPEQPDVTTLVNGARDRHANGSLDAVFIPDSATAAVAVGGALHAAAPGLGILGPNDWNNPTVLASAGSRLDGAVFVAGFFDGSSRPATRAFTDAFRRRYNAIPDIFAAQGYDAGAILATVLARDASSREAARSDLLTQGAVTGATGEIRVTAAGIVRELYLLRIAGGKIEEVGR